MLTLISTGEIVASQLDSNKIVLLTAENQDEKEGTFYTPSRLLSKQLINELKEAFKDEKILDPFAGTGGVILDNKIKLLEGIFDKFLDNKKIKVEIKQIRISTIKDTIIDVLHIINEEHKAGNSITFSITDGAKVPSIACLLAVYKAKNKIKNCYYKTETGQVLQLPPSLDLTLSETKRNVLDKISNGKTVNEISKDMTISNVMVYRIIKELKIHGLITQAGNELTDMGKIAIL